MANDNGFGKRHCYLGLASRCEDARGVSWVSTILYSWRIVLDKLVVKVEKNRKKFMLWEGEHLEDCFVQSPTALFPDESDKYAVMTYLAYGDAIGYMHGLLKISLNTELACQCALVYGSSGQHRSSLHFIEVSLICWSFLWAPESTDLLSSKFSSSIAVSTRFFINLRYSRWCWRMGRPALWSWPASSIHCWGR